MEKEAFYRANLNLITKTEDKFIFFLENLSKSEAEMKDQCKIENLLQISCYILNVL